jgi:hypothetical protein
LEKRNPLPDDDETPPVVSEGEYERDDPHADQGAQLEEKSILKFTFCYIRYLL